MLILTIFLVSLSTLAFEVLLTRVFSIGQWNHLSFMVISIALFGFAASGTFLSMLDDRKKEWLNHFSTPTAVALMAGLYTSTTLLSFFSLTKIPLDYFRLSIEPIQSFYLLAAYILLALPFFFSGLLISLGYTVIPEKTGLVYFASMAGSALGAIFPPALIPYFGEERLIIISALFPLVIIPFTARKCTKGNNSAKKYQRFIRMSFVPYGLALIALAALLLTPKGLAVIKVQPSPYKALSQILQFPDTRIIEEMASIRGRTQRINTPYIRFAPGLSLKYTDILPQQHAVFLDGDNQFVVYELSSRDDAQFAKYTLSFSGYQLIPSPQKVLVIENGGGLAIACAVASGADEINIAVQNPHRARMIHNHYHLPVIIQNPRAYLARSPHQFDIIHVEDWGASIPGSDALNQHHLLSTDAFLQYLKHLTPDGVIIVSRRLLLPPANSIRLWAAAYDSLKLMGIKHPQSHLAMLRNWDTFTLIISAKPLQNLETINKFAGDLNFDIVFAPGVDLKTVNRFNKFAEPYHFREISRLAEAYAQGKENNYFNAYLLDVVPQSDNRPFPGRFLKWFQLNALYKSMGSRLYALFMSGEIVVAVVFVEALLISVILLFVPQLFILGDGRKPYIFQIIYFLGVGAGFMFVELFFIKRFILLFGNPVISFTVVISGVLISSSLGGLWSQDKKKAGIRWALIILIGALVITGFSLDWITRHMLGLFSPWRYLFAFLLLIPSGFLMGLPFPLGMRLLLKNPGQRSYAWSVNGCASVLASIGSAQIALSFGIPYIMGVAILAYITALLSTLKQ
jgi:MFS family permease